MNEMVVLVDEKDNTLGEMDKLEAHREALLHRAVSVFVFNSEGKLLLQKRALGKYHSPGLWTNTACTHPNTGESNEEAVIRRLKQEMGISVDSVRKLFDFIYKEPVENGLTEYELDHVFVGFSDERPVCNLEEVCDFDYVDVDELLEKIKSNSKDYTVWFKAIIGRVVGTIKNQ